MINDGLAQEKKREKMVKNVIDIKKGRKNLPPYESAAPCQTAPEYRKANEVAIFDAPVPYRLIKGNGTG